MTIKMNDDPNEDVPQHDDEKKGFDPLPKGVADLEPDYLADETDELDETVLDIPESELADAADSQATDEELGETENQEETK